MKYLKLGILLIFLILATGVSFAMTDDNNSSLESNDPAAIESEQGNIEKLSVANQAKNSDIGPIQNCCSILSTSKSDEDSNKSANDKLGIQAVDNGNTQSVYINDINMSNNISKSKIGTTNITPLKSRL